MFTKAKLFHAAGEGSGGGGGGDQHNLGWYATESALTTAHPTATDGDWAIVGATDTVWVWDSDTTAWKDTGQAGIELPDQTGNSGKFLTTDGSSASWGIAYSFNSYSATWGTATGSYAIGLGDDSQATGPKAVAIGQDARGNGSMALALGYGARVTANNAIQLNTSGTHTNSDASTFKVGNVYGNFEMMSADGTIPTARLTNAINKYSSMPTASADYLGQIVQFTGTTDATYTHGYIYECVSDGGNPATYSWTQVDVQPSSSGGLQNTATGTYALTILGTPTTTTNATNICEGSSATGNGSLSIGRNCSVSGNWGIGIGLGITVTGAYAIQLGKSASNSDANTFKVANQYGNFEIMDANGFVPTGRLTKVNSTITLTAAGWSSNTQTVNVTGMTATGVVFPCPIPADQSAYTSAGILCTAQAAGTLTFTCDTVPSADIDVNVVML